MAQDERDRHLDQAQAGVAGELRELLGGVELAARFHPMIKPYHRFPEYSKVPLPLLRELEERSLTT